MSLTLAEYRKLPIELKTRVELSNCLQILIDCKWYELKKKRLLRNHSKLIISTYSIEKLPYLLT